MASLVKVFSVVQIADFIRPQVHWLLKSASLQILEDSRFLAHRGPLGKFQFWQVWSVFSVCRNAYFWRPKVPWLLNKASHTQLGAMPSRTMQPDLY